jgi:drug/metabolite transporter (DMT)-like permease
VIPMNRATLALLLAMLAWGTSVTVADAALAELSAADLLLLETLAGTGAVILACLATGRPVTGAWRPAFALGSLEPGIAYVFANLGLALTAAAAGSMLLALESVFVVLLAWLVLAQRPMRGETYALGLGVVGAVLVASGESGGTSSGLGTAFMLLSALGAAAYAIVSRQVVGGHEPIALVARQGMASLLVTAPFILGSWFVQGSRIPEASVSALGLAVLTGLLGFALPFTLWTVAIPHVRPGFAAVSLNVIPVVGVLTAALLGRGLPQGTQLLGGALILGGLVVLTRAELANVTVQPSHAVNLRPAWETGG